MGKRINNTYKYVGKRMKNTDKYVGQPIKDTHKYVGKHIKKSGENTVENGRDHHSEPFRAICRGMGPNFLSPPPHQLQRLADKIYLFWT